MTSTPTLAVALIVPSSARSTVLAHKMRKVSPEPPMIPLSISRDSFSRAEYERRFQLLFENPELMGVILDLEGRIQFASVGFLKKTGLARSRTLGADSFDLVVPDSSQRNVDQCRD